MHKNSGHKYSYPSPPVCARGLQTLYAAPQSTGASPVSAGATFAPPPPPAKGLMPTEAVAEARATPRHDWGRRGFPGRWDPLPLGNPFGRFFFPFLFVSKRRVHRRAWRSGGGYNPDSKIISKDIGGHKTAVVVEVACLGTGTQRTRTRCLARCKIPGVLHRPLCTAHEGTEIEKAELGGHPAHAAVCAAGEDACVLVIRAERKRGRYTVLCVARCISIRFPSFFFGAAKLLLLLLQ
jgi:hypothetical protein